MFSPYFRNCVCTFGTCKQIYFFFITSNQAFRLKIFACLITKKKKKKKKKDGQNPLKI